MNAMSQFFSYPAYFSEITCISSPHPSRRGTIEVPRVALANADILIRGAFGNAEFDQGDDFPRIREIELLFKYDRYIIVKSDDGRHFISFKDIVLRSEQEFLRYARSELTRVNRVIATLVPSAEAIVVQNTVYLAESETSMSQCYRENEQIAGPIRFETVDDIAIVEKWKKAARELIEKPSDLLFKILEGDGRDPILTTCVNLVSRNDFPSYYTALELLAQHYGRHHKFIKLGLLDKDTFSRFRDNAQVYRHANHKLATKEMSLAEAKLLVIAVLDYYVKHPVPNQIISR